MENKILLCIKPLYQLFYLCGFLCLKLDVARNKIIVTSKAYTVTLAFVLSLFACGVIVLYISLRIVFYPSAFQYMGMIIYLSTLALKIIVVMMMRAICAEKLALLWRKLLKIENDFKIHKIKSNTNILKYGIFLVKLHSLVTVLYIVYTGSFANVLHHPGEIAGFVLAQLLNLRVSIVGVEFIAFLVLLQNYFKQLNLFFHELVRRHNETRKQIDFGVVQNLFASLSDLTREICHVLSPQVVVIFAEAMVVLTSRSYVVLSKFYGSSFTKGSSFSIALSMFWVWNSCLCFFLAITPSYMCMQSANNIKRTLRNIEFYSRGPAVARNIKSFSLQLLHEDFKITAGGLFTIDLSLAYMVIGALTTYITIIVQFDLMYFK